MGPVSGDYSHLAGHRFPGATYTLPEYVTWLWEDCILAEHDASAAHPSLAYFVAMAGLGTTIAEVMALLEGSPDSGVMFGENELELRGVLRPGCTYECAGEIVSVERKAGRRAGVFDKLTFRVDVREAGDPAPVAVCTSSWIFPRRDGGDG
jgi:hypothetical protein